jgi:hypothetical protein
MGDGVPEIINFARHEYSSGEKGKYITRPTCIHHTPSVFTRDKGYFIVVVSY